MGLVPSSWSIGARTYYCLCYTCTHFWFQQVLQFLPVLSLQCYSLTIVAEQPALLLYLAPVCLIVFLRAPIERYTTTFPAHRAPRSG